MPRSARFPVEKIAAKSPQPGKEEAMSLRMRAMAIVLTTAFALTGAVRAAEPVKIRVGWVVPTTDWVLFIDAKRDLTRHLGKSYTIEPVRFASSPTVITALASNGIDVGNLAFSTLAIAVRNAGIGDLRVVTDLFQDGVADHFSNEFLVAREGAVARVEDLKGKVIATPGAGGAIDMAMRVMLRRHGLEEKRDYTMIEAPMPAMKAMLAERKVDLVPGVPPFAFDPDLRKIARVLFTQRDALGPTQMLMLTARQQFLDKNRAAMIDFLEDNLRVVRWYLDPANHDAAVTIAARLTKQPPAKFAGWLFTGRDYYRDPNMVPNVPMLQANIDLQRDAGFLNEPIDIGDYADLGLIQEAARRL
jgi:sulfonate transport system substrate-binding protein